MNKNEVLTEQGVITLTEGEKVIVRPSVGRKISLVNIITIQGEEYDVNIDLMERHPQDVLDEFNGKYKDKTIRTILAEVNKNSQSNERQFLLKIIKNLFPGTDYETFFDSIDFRDQIIFLGLLSIFSSGHLAILNDPILNLLNEEQARILFEYISESNRTFILVSTRNADYGIFKQYEKGNTTFITVREPLNIGLSMIVGNERKHVEKILAISQC